MSVDALSTLSGSLCAWLRKPLATLEAAHGGGRLGHAWLIAGPSGLGKLNLALVFADRLLRGRVGTQEPPELSAAHALEAMRDRHKPADHHPDLHWLFPEEDKRSISIEQVREALESLALKGHQGGAKVLLIEPAEAMTVAAANALLKSLEEPQGQTYMLLVSEQAGRLPSTVRSRCQTLLVHGPKADLAAAGATGGTMTGSRAELAPLRLARNNTQEYYLFINDLNDSLNSVYDMKRDPQAVADEWLKKEDTAQVLDWLTGRIRRAVRTRIVLSGSNPITEPRPAVLHNEWQALTLAKLFEQLAAAERLREQLGGGINAELALRVLLLGFVPERGRP
jgi:DNA polymerase III subunit delta'